MEKFIWISAGAIAGANLRYWVGDWAAVRWGSNFPFGTLIINLSGSFVLGLIMAMITDHYVMDPRLRLALTIGFLGSYTTFSTYTYESISLLQQGQGWLALFNLIGSSLLGGVFAFVGIWVGKMI